MSTRSDYVGSWNSLVAEMLVCLTETIDNSSNESMTVSTDFELERCTVLIMKIFMQAILSWSRKVSGRDIYPLLNIAGQWLRCDSVSTNARSYSNP